MICRTSFLSIALALCAVSAAFQPGEPFKPGKLPPAEVAKLQQGLTLRFYAKAAGAKSLDARRVRLAALHVPANESPSPFVAPGPFAAKFSGYVKNTLKGTFSFRLTGTGSVVLKINDKIVLKQFDKEIEVELAKNFNRIEIDYVSPPKGNATMRLYWSGEKFGFEPVPPDVLSSRKDEADLVEQTTLREGRELIARFHCANCHELPGKIAHIDCKMPEFHAKAPDLSRAGEVFTSAWLAAWLRNPRSLRPEAAMPSVLDGPNASKTAADITAYLLSLNNAKQAPVVGKAPDGAALFQRLGCNSCHRLDDPQAADELGRLSLHHVHVKYQQGALARFLKKPHERYAWTRMPDFRLSDMEAGSLELYLREQAKGLIEASAPGDQVRGEKLFREVGCNHCHQLTKEPANSLALIQSLDKGCLASKGHGKAPDFMLSESQRTALTAFMKTDGKSLTRDTPAEFAARQVKALQCASCHRRDGELTRWHAVLEETGKVPEALPSLTWTGEKLKPAWTKKLLAGESDHSARPWIKARMPAFPARAEMLAVGLSHEHGFGALEDDRPPHDAKQAVIGEKLIPQQGGFNCINCHGIGKTPPLAPFEAPGINLLDAAIRLRYEYYQRWMLAPDRVDVVMRMPVFAVDGKTTQIREVFDGDARKQFGALWHYIQTLPGKKP